MKLSKTQFLLLSFMLFSLFFGAGNLIFPPYLGQHATTNLPSAFLGFCLSAVILPVCGIVVVAKCDGLQKLANRVNPIFSFIFTLLIYVSIGPGLGIPRAASVPFEMAISTYLPQDAPLKLYLLLFSIMFFFIAFWLSYTPSKLVERIGKFLTPSLLTLIFFLFFSFIFHGSYQVSTPSPSYQNRPLLEGFLFGYQTMDAIAALNFGLVISLTLQEFQIHDKKSILSYTKKAGITAGCLLMTVYMMLAYMGMASSKQLSLNENGAITLRQITEMLFGSYGSILMISMFTLACLTTCVGLITSISKYFSSIFPNISYQKWVILITVFSCLICNQGLDSILHVSTFILNAIYPIAIVLILLGLMDQKIPLNSYYYPFVVYSTTIVAFVYVIDQIHLLPSFLSFFSYLPLYSIGLGWIVVAICSVLFAYIIQHLHR